METTDRLSDILRDPGILIREHAEEVKRYEQAGRIGRLLMRRKDPYIARHYQFAQHHQEYVRAQESVTEAKRSAQQHEGNIVIF